MLSLDPKALHDAAIFCLGMAAAIHEFASDDVCPDVDAARDLESVYWDHREAPLSAAARRLNALHKAPVQYGSFARPNAHLMCFDFARRVLDVVWASADPDGFDRAAPKGVDGSVRIDFTHFEERWPAVAQVLRLLDLPDHRVIAAAVEQEAARLSAEPSAPNDPGVPAPVNRPQVVLRGHGKRPIVSDVEKDPLTLPQYDVVNALLEAGERGLSKDELDRKSKHGDARKILKRLAESDPDWNTVIHFPGKPRGGYRIG